MNATKASSHIHAFLRSTLIKSYEKNENLSKDNINAWEILSSGAKAFSSTDVLLNGESFTKANNCEKSTVLNISAVETSSFAITTRRPDESSCIVPEP